MGTEVIAMSGYQCTALEEKRVLIVADRDFSELIFHQGLAHASVIFLRLPGAKLQTKIDQLNTVLAEHSDDLEHGWCEI